MPRTYRILLIEGHLPDAVLVERTLANDDVRLRVVYDIDEAQQMLRRQPPYEGMLLPDLILIDAELPGGISPMLVFLRQDRALQRLPVLLLRTPAQGISTGPLTYTLYTTGSLQRPSAVIAAEALLDALRQPWGPWSLPDVAEA